MEDFGAIEDDYVSFHEKSDHYEQKYEALRCEPAWFTSSDEGNELINIKYKADYFYLKKKYSKAIDSYKTYIDECKNINLTVKRECLEGICRSYMSLHCHCSAQKFANELDSLATTFDMYTASLSLLYDCSIMAQRYKDSIIYGKKLVLLHCSNSDVWLKLCLAFSLFYKVPLFYVSLELIQPADSPDINLVCEAKTYSLQCTCEMYSDENTSANGILHILACLLYAEFHLKSVINTSVGFALSQNIELIRKIQNEAQRLCLNEDYVENFRENIRMLYTGIKNDKEAVNTEFIDRTSSKFSSSEHTTCGLEEFNEKEFEEKWFPFN